MLSNVLLDDLDKELERRGLHFVRYADDFQIFVRSERSAHRVFASVKRFLTQRLKLVVNEEKSSVRPALGCEYLGFTFVGKRVTIKVAPKKLKAFKQRIKELTGRSRGISMERRRPPLRVGARDLNRYVRGWIGYFGLARQFDDFADLDGWIRRRVRMCYWKQWRHLRTKVKKLVALGVSLDMEEAGGHPNVFLDSTVGRSEGWKENLLDQRLLIAYAYRQRRFTAFDP